jgi:hypothetical protein
MSGSTPKAKTTAKKVGQGADPGRPAVVPYRNLAMSQDKSRMEGYRFLWQKIKPQPIVRAEEMMDHAMPVNLRPQVLQNVLANKHRREH